MMLKIQAITGGHCITMDAGEKVYDAILPELSRGNHVTLDFEGISVYASPFFNAGIGRLLKDIDLDQLRGLLAISNISPVGSSILKRVLENSRQYYTDSAARRALDDILDQQASESE